MYVLAVTRWTRQITKGPEQSSRYLRMLVKKKILRERGKNAAEILKVQERMQLIHFAIREIDGEGGGGGGRVTFDNSFMVKLMLNIIYPGNELGLNIALTTTRKAMRKRICIIGCCS